MANSAMLGKCFGSMENLQLVEMRRLLDKGKRLYVGRDAAGRHKLKFKTGPFGLLTKRYTVLA
jgi:hypothetical protein